MQRPLICIFLNDFLSFLVISIKWGTGSLFTTVCFPTAYVKTTYFNRMRLTAKQWIYSNNKINPSNNSALQDPAWIWKGDYLHSFIPIVFYQRFQGSSVVDESVSCYPAKPQTWSVDRETSPDLCYREKRTPRKKLKRISGNRVNKEESKKVCLGWTCLLPWTQVIYGNWFKMLPVRNLHVQYKCVTPQLMWSDETTMF